MKKIIIGIVSVVIIAYIAVWFYVANKIQDEFHNFAKKNDNLFKYKEVSVSGFPFDFKIIVREPVYKFISQDGNASLKVDGDIFFSAGLFATKFTLDSNGPWLMKGRIRDYNFKIRADAQQDTAYTVKLNSSPLSKEFISSAMGLSDNPYLIFKLIDYVQIKGRGLDVFNVSSQTSVLKIKDLKVKVSLDDLGKGEYRIYFDEDLVNASFSYEFLKLWESVRMSVPQLRSVHSKLPPKLRNYFSVLNLAERGKINHDIDFSVKGDFQSKNPKIEVDVDKLYMKDSLSYVNSKGEITFNQNADGSPNAELDLNMEAKFSDKWYNLAKKYASRYGAGIFKFSNESSGFLKLVSSVTGFLDIGVSKAGYMPKLNEFGEIEVETKLDIKSRSREKYHLNVQNLNIKMPLYSAELNGKYHQKDNLENYELNAKFKNYKKIISDMLNYVKQVGSSQGLLLLIGGGQFEVSQKTQDMIYQFMRDVSNSPNSDSANIAYRIKKKFSEEFPAVGKYDSAKFKSKWGKFKARLVFNEVRGKLEKILPQKQTKKLAKALGKFGDLGEGLLSGVLSK